MRKSYRILCLLVCLTMICSTALAADYTLPEKMHRQVTFGSGVKGAMTLAVAGGAEWLDLLLPFTGSELQVRYIYKDGHFQLQLYAVDDQEQQRALTQAYGDETHLYLRSDLAPNTLLSLPIGSALMDELFGGDAENPTFYSAVQALLSVPSDEWEKDWAPALSPYESALETWLTQFASGPSISQADSGASTMTLRYDIPAASLKEAMKDLMGKVLQDETLLGLVRPMLSAGQQAVYLNPTIAYFYDAVIDQLPLSDSLTMARVLSTRGELLSSELVMPLPENANRWTSLTLTMTGDETELTLTGADQSIAVALKEDGSLTDRTSWDGTFRYLPAEGTPVSAAFSLAKAFSKTTDEADGRGHERTTWTLTAKPDLTHLAADDPARADYADFDDISVSFTTHYSSREQDNNPTTLELSLSAQLPGVMLNSDMALRTTTPWVFTALPTDGAESILTLTGERVAALLGEFSRNAALTMTSLVTAPAETAEPEIAEEPTIVPPAQ